MGRLAALWVLQDRIELSSAKQAFRSALVDYAGSPDDTDPDDAVTTRRPSVASSPPRG